MLNRQRYDEDRVPTAQERSAVRGRMEEAYLYQGQPRIRRRTFEQTWRRYMQEEQQMLDALIAAETLAIERDQIKLYTIDDVLKQLQSTMDVLGCTAMKAIRLHMSFEGKYVEELEIERKAA